MADPFDLLALEPRFALDAKALEQRHRELSKALHPDRHSGAPATERRLALSRAIEVNDAFRLLRDPVRRGEALLQRRGWAEDLEKTTASPALLMEVMESREALQEAQAHRDRAGITELGKTMEARRAKVLASLSKALDEAPSAPLEQGALLLAELRYLQRFLDEVSALLEDLDDAGA